MKRIARITAGWILIALGLAGLILPVLQGVLFVTFGVVLLAPDIPALRRLLEWIKHRWPRSRTGVEKMQQKIEKLDSAKNC